MPKAVLNIENFSGGLNNNTTPRDVKEPQSIVLNGIDIETPGLIKTMGSVEDYALVSSTNDEVTSSTVNYGNGLLHLNLDRRVSSAINADDTQYLFINDPSAYKVRILDIDNNTLLSSGDYILTYGSTNSSKVEYTVIDGEIRVSPYVDGTLPFLITNQIKKLKFMKTIKTLGIDVADLSSALEGPTTYTSVYKTDAAYVAPIKCNPAAKYGSPDGYGYDVEGVMGTSTWFKADYESEATCNTMFVESDIDNLEYTINMNLDTITNKLDEHADWTSGYGGLELAIWTGSTVDTDSEIYNFYSASNAADNNYEIFASNKYENQESVAVHIGTVMNHAIANQTVDKKVPLYYCILGRVPKNPFQSGINYYWARKTDGEIGQKYLLFEVDFEKGYRKGGEKTFEPFTESYSGLTGDPIYTSNLLAYSNGVDLISGINKKLLSLPDREPYIEKKDTSIGRLGTGYKTSTIINRRAYVGNVGYYDKKSDSTTYIKNANDTIIKSEVNEFDYFPLNNLIDVEINDGENIIKLASVGDKLLEFKEHTLYIINCSRDLEFLEGTFKYRGVAKQYHVVEGEGFVGWVNQYGLFLYDGEKILNVLLDDFGQKKLKDWDTAYYHINNVIGYLPHKQTIFIGNKNGMVLMYDLKSGGFFYSSDKFETNDITNMVTTNDGKLLWYEKDSTTLKVHRWNDTSVALDLNGVILQTKEHTFGTPDVRKKMSRVYINHKNGKGVKADGTASDSTGAVTVKGFKNGDISNLYTLTTSASDSLLTNTGTFSTQEIRITHTNLKNCKSFGLALTHDGADANQVNPAFELNDMQITYREKTRK